MSAAVHSHRSSTIFASVRAISLALGVKTAVAKEPELQRVRATYKIILNSFEIGTLPYESSAGLNEYVLENKVELSVRFGAVSWHGATRSSGASHYPNPLSGTIL